MHDLLLMKLQPHYFQSLSQKSSMRRPCRRCHQFSIHDYIISWHRLEISTRDRHVRSYGGICSQRASFHHTGSSKDLNPMTNRSNRVVFNRKSTRLNSSHVATSYAVFCSKKNKMKRTHACT